MQKDLVAAILLLLIAAAYYAASLEIPMSSLSDEIGPTGLPTVLAGLLAVLAVAIAARALLIPRRSSAPSSPAPEKDAEAPWLRALGMLGLIALYIPLASVLGYGPALFLVISSVALYEGMKPSWRLFLVAAGGAAFFFVLFDLILGVRQPEGLFF
jgi:putative tricarboxylic transport membrane protein